MDIRTIKNILSRTKTIVKHHDELSKLKGEGFNIFSILNMESSENSTHSAFLGELLNPVGTHQKGNIFLKLFLNEIGSNSINIESAQVFLERHIGERNDENKTGGRVDIYISDAFGNTVCIENKIYASDQNVQIERYVNHNKYKNEVYYLTLDGSDASEGSKGMLEEGKDYFCISYRHSVVDWLEACFKEAAEHPILRETIKQYTILIKKLTNQLSSVAMEKEIEELIKNNYEAASIVASSITNVELIMATTFLNEIKSYSEKDLDDDWIISIDDDLSKSWTGLDIVHKSWGKGIAVGLEGQSKLPWHNSVYGIKASKDLWDRNDINSKIAHIDFLQSGFRESGFWPRYKVGLKFGQTNEREKLFSKMSRDSLKMEIGNKLIDLAKAVEQILANAIKLK